MNFKASREFTFIISADIVDKINWLQIDFEITSLVKNDIPISLLIPDVSENSAQKIVFCETNKYIKTIPMEPAIGIDDCKIQLPFKEKFFRLFGCQNFSGRYEVKLILLAKQYKVDGIITENKLLLEHKYNLLLSPEKIRVIAPAELMKWIQIIAHGHNWYQLDKYSQTPSLYYTLEDKIGKKYFAQLMTFCSKAYDKNLQEFLRNAFLNRLTAIIHTKDLLLFYDLQHDYYEKLNEEPTSIYYFEYYHNYFFFLIWGMLEQMTHAIKMLLGINMKRCGIQNNTFWDKTGLNGLIQYLQSEDVSNWFNRITHIRHPASHRYFPQIKTVLDESSPSFQMTEEEVKQAILSENPDLNSISADTRDLILEMEISNWRSNNAEIMMTKSAFIKEDNEPYFSNPTIEVEYHLNKLLSVIDRFLEEMINLTEKAES